MSEFSISGNRSIEKVTGRFDQRNGKQFNDNGTSKDKNETTFNQNNSDSSEETTDDFEEIENQSHQESKPSGIGDNIDIEA